MKVVFDTNVILNAAMGRPGFQEAQQLIQAVLEDKIEGAVTANSITDIHYIVKKRTGEEKARAVVRYVLSIFETIPVDGEACARAFEVRMNDYEDAVLAVCASHAGADYIATGDEAFIMADGSPVRALRPADVLDCLAAAGDI